MKTFKNITTRPEGRRFSRFTQHHVNDGGGGNEDEARYNLATRVMSNGVEVIVADGKSTLPGEPNFFRILTNSKHYNRPTTLAPSTLNNIMMLMTLGGKSPKIDNIPDYAIINRFVTKTCLTTYTYLTTYTENGSTMIESREKVISNIATEERNTANMTPLIASDMTFFKTPNLKVGQFSTTYTYYNTIMDEDVPIVATSKHVVVNTITAADDYLKLIQPTASALPVYETNTYFTTVEFSKTISEDAITKVINTQDVMTQVIVTESLPHGRMPMSMSHLGHLDQSEEDVVSQYHNNNDEDAVDSGDDYDDETEVENHIKKTSGINVLPTRINQKPIQGGNTNIPLHLYATKTYLTTFTYFTTLLQSAPDKKGEILTTVDSHTRVIENVITESIASSMIPTNILSSISTKLFKDEKNDLKTRITLKNGQKLEITAANILKPVNFATASPAEELKDDDDDDVVVDSNDLDVEENEPKPAVLTVDGNESFISADESANIGLEPPPLPPLKSPIKTKPVSPSFGSGSLKIPSILNSISVPNLSVLGPVINAMAGLLQNNFGTPQVKIHAAPLVQPSPTINHHHHHHEALPQPLPLLSPESQDLILSQTDAKNTHPLYIPVREGDKHAMMMGSGIPISPGDVITANSDVIVGRPAVIGPQLPANVNNNKQQHSQHHQQQQQQATEIEGMKAPPPFVPIKTPQRPSSFVKDFKSNGNINQVVINKNDDYIGPVPPNNNAPQQQQQHQHKPIPISTMQRPPPPQTHHQHQHQHPQTLQKIPPMMRPSIELKPHINQQQNSKPNPSQETRLNNHFVKINHQEVSQKLPPFIRQQPTTTNQEKTQPPPRIINQQHKINEQNHVPNRNQFKEQPPRGTENHQHQHHHHQQHQHHKKNHHSQHNQYLHHHQQHQQQSSQQHQHQNDKINSKPIFAQVPPNVIEIKKAPEVFSTDLPIITVNNAHLYQIPGNSPIISHSHELPEIYDKPTKGQPLLVDLQPSQVANVVIPHGSSSVLVFGGVHKTHKTGQYFDDPSPHGNAEVGIKSVNLLADIVGGNNVHQAAAPSNVYHDVKDNIIVASDNVPVPIPSVSVTIPHSNNNNIQPSRPHHSDYLSHSVRVVPNSVLHFHPDSNENNFRRPTSQQIINLQKQQQIEIANQLKQKQIENQKRNELENQKRQEMLNRQKQIEEQKRREEEETHLKHIEMERKEKFERQKQLEYEQRQKQIQQRQQEIEAQKKLQQQLQHVLSIGSKFNKPQHPPPPQDSGFIVLASNYGNQQQGGSGSHSHNNQHQQQQQFIPLPSQKRPSQDNDDELDNDTGEFVQESVNRPKLPSGENLDDEENVKIEEFDNFVYHKIANTEEPSTTTQRSTSQTAPITTRRTSYVPISTERFNPTTERHQKPYPNLQFDNLPKYVNDLQPPPLNPPKPNNNYNKFQRLPIINPMHKPNLMKTLSQSMQPPSPPPQKISRRPTSSSHKTTFKISMPINPMPDDVNVVNNLQTEEPFNPMYTENYTEAPSFVTPRSATTTTKSNQVTTSTTTTTATSKPMTSTTTRKTTTTTEPPPKTTTKTSETSELNIGEIEAKDKNNRTLNEEIDIFDSKETIHALNDGFVKHHNAKETIDLMPPSIRKPYQTIIRGSASANAPGLKLEIASSELSKMRPPPPAFTHETTTRTTTTATSTKTTTEEPTTKSYLDLRPPTSPKTTPQSEKSKTKRPSISLSRYPPTSPTDQPASAHNNYVTLNRGRPFKTSSTVWNRYTTEKPEIYEVIMTANQGGGGSKKSETSRKNNNNNNNGSKIIIGSVETVENDHHVKPSINATPVQKSETTSDEKPSVRTSISISSSVRSSFSRPRLPTTINFDRNRTKVVLPERTRISTKFVTNTQTITVAQTTTEVISPSHGTPITTTRVYTQTVFETVTETETLLKPTTITTVHSIHPTATLLIPQITETARPHHPFSESQEEIVEGFPMIHDDDEDLDEFILNYDEDRNETTITHVKDQNEQQQHHQNNKQSSKSSHENESIFVVMTDKKKGGNVVNIDPSIFNTSVNEIDDVSRGEEDQNNSPSLHVLGGIFIATHGAATTEICYPECKNSNNEYCHRATMKCVCRPGFSRMFADQPCQPIYTYILELTLARRGKERLTYNRTLADRNSTSFTSLSKITHDGVDRMMMQSDLHNIYHSSDVIGFNTSKFDQGVKGKMFIQLLENTNERKLKEIVKKYLRLSNYNLGGTELYANPLIAELDTYDYDECSGVKDINHDCSEFASCYNLLGTYTCSCREGFTDESENPVYPGRICVHELTGCELCHYHGTCITKPNDQLLCECFQWYTGKNCQINLKFILFGLVVTGLTLFMLMMICLIGTCVKRKRIHQNAIAPTMNIIQRRISGSAHQSVSSHADRKAMIQDTSSEVSEESDPAPYFRKKSNDETTQRRISIDAVSPKKKKSVPNQNPLGSFSKGTMEQRDRSLTVIIPRAKFHAGSKQNLIDVEAYKSKSSSSLSVNQTKLINYLDASPSSSKIKNNVPCEKTNNYQPQNPGALVSAGFKVSATGGANGEQNRNQHHLSKTSSQQNINEPSGSRYYAVHKISTMSEQPLKLHDEKAQLAAVRKSYSHGNLIDSLEDWMDNGHNAELAMSEARSYDETTIQAPTKAIRNIYFKQPSTSQIEEMNTMAERDLGSTVLLPHTHLYKPSTDRGSDISGFDSL